MPKYSATKLHLEKDGYCIDKCLEGPRRPRNVCVPCGVALTTEGAHPSPLKRLQARVAGKRENAENEEPEWVEAGRGGACGTAVGV